MLKSIKSSIAKVLPLLHNRILLVAVLGIASICAAALLGFSINTIHGRPLFVYVKIWE